jgi:menaquinone-dependent protoporphyrinogen oxidase
MSASAVGRRRFLKAGGTAAGVLAAGGAGVWAACPRVDLPELSGPATRGSGDRVLIAYASKAGSTAEVAAFIARKLVERGVSVDLRRAGHVGSVDGYRAVIVGSAIRAGQWLAEASEFVKAHRQALASRRTAFFTLCMTLREDTASNREKVAAYLKPVREMLEPDRSEFFAGKLDCRTLALGPRLIVKAMKVPQGDFRNWGAIGAWAEALNKDVLASA